MRGLDCTPRQAYPAGAGFSTVGVGLVTPTDHLADHADADDLVLSDRPGDDELEAS